MYTGDGAVCNGHWMRVSLDHSNIKDTETHGDGCAMDATASEEDGDGVPPEW